MKTKLLIPVILATVMMIGATFAVAPVEKASTVHTTIIAAINNALGTGTGGNGNNLVNRASNFTATKAMGNTLTLKIPKTAITEAVGQQALTGVTATGQTLTGTVTIFVNGTLVAGQTTNGAFIFGTVGGVRTKILSADFSNAVPILFNATLPASTTQLFWKLNGTATGSTADVVFKYTP